MGKLIVKSIYTPEVYQSCLDRIDRLEPGSIPQWGTMTAAQMLAHCAEIQDVANGKDLNGTPFLVRLFKGMVRNMVVNDKPYPRNTRTHPQYRQTSDSDFASAKARLLTSTGEFVSAGSSDAGDRRHPLFGEMTAEEKGWSIYKHLDHHLTQFGV